MSRTAKITLTAEVRGFKQAVGDARKTLESLSDIQLDNDSVKKLKDMLGKELTQRAKDVKEKMESINSELKSMSESDAFDSKKAAEYTKALKGMKETLEDIKKTQDDIAKTPLDQFVDKLKGGGGKLGGLLGGGGGKGGGGMIGGLLSGGGLTRILGPLAAAFGVRGMFNRLDSQADANLKVRGLASDGGKVGGMSGLGFTQLERAQRGAEMAQAMGGGSAADITRMVDMGETVERAFGVDGGTSSGFVSASRRAGGSASGKEMSNAIGAAVAAGLEGSKISEYLGAMTGYMESLSQGVNIDQSSLTGFAGALSSMPFFRNDPSRSFSTIRSLDATFKGGDAFQTAMANRAIMRTAGPLDAAQLSNRRAAGLFGNNLDASTMAQLKKAGVNTKGLQTSGADIIQGMFADTMESTAGMSGDERLNAFRQRLGMDFGDSATLFAQLSSGRGPSKDMVKKFQEAQMSPEERLQKTMGNLDGSVKQLGAAIDRLILTISEKLMPPLIQIANSLLKMFGEDGSLASGVEGAANAAVGVAGVGAGLYGASKVKGLAAGATGIAKKVAPKAIGKMGASAAGKLAGRSIPIIKNIMALGYTASDAYDIYQKKMAGEDVSGLDWAKLGMSAGSILDPTPATGLARMGMDFIPEGSDTPSFEVPATSTGFGGSPSPMMPTPMPASGNDAATIQNTNAINNLTAALQKKSQGNMAPPSYMRPAANGMTVGK